MGDMVDLGMTKNIYPKQVIMKEEVLINNRFKLIIQPSNYKLVRSIYLFCSLNLVIHTLK